VYQIDKIIICLRAKPNSMTFFYIYKKIKFHWINVAGIFIFSCSHPICEEVTTTIILKPGAEGKDAIVSSSQPDSNYAGGKSLNAIAWTYFRKPLQVEASFLDFEIEKAIPKKVKIKKAVLKLYADTTNLFDKKAGHIDFDKIVWRLNLITSNWKEDSITWSNQPEVEKSVFKLIEEVPSSNFQAFSIDVTEYVRRKITKLPEIYGIKIDLAILNIPPNQPKEEPKEPGPPTTALRFCSSDHQYRELWPELSIEYEIAQ
jgi:hypothetical protein